MTDRSVRGFTIIEVLIAVAIGSLIFLIVFLAVPSLMRSARNYRRNTDAHFIAVQRLQYNIDNKTTVVMGGYDCASPLTAKLFCTYIQDSLQIYDLDRVRFHNSGTTAPTTVPTITDINEILTDTFLKCDAQGQNAQVAPGNSYMVVLYMVETISGPQQRCFESTIVPH